MRSRQGRWAGAAMVGAAALAFAMMPTATAGPDKAKDTKPNEIKVQLLSFNDYHGHLDPPSGGDATLGSRLDPDLNLVGGAEYLSTTLKSLRGQADHSLTVAAGDLIGGSPFLSGLFHDEPSVETLEEMGLDISSVGNHEFDEGLTELLRMQEGGCHPVDGCYDENDPYDGADFDYLAANVVHASTGETVLPGTKIEEVDGVKIGFIGMTLEDTPILVAQSGIRGLEFRDEVETANAAAKELKKQGVKSIVVLLHEGGAQGGTYGSCVGISGPIVEIAENLDPEIDLVITGHTHQPYICNIPDPDGEPRMVTSASSYGRVVTETWLSINTKSGQVERDQTEATNHLVTRDVARDPAQTVIIEKWKALSAPIANRVVGSIAEDIVGSAGGDRGAESALAHLIADAQLAATSAPEDGGAQIALMNLGGVRADLIFDQISGGEQPGQVTYGEAFAVQPFGNLLVTMDLTGAQLQLVLEQQFRSDRGRQQLFFGISEGLTFEWHSSAPEGSKIPDESVMLKGQPIDPAATYRVTVNNFLADGGDGFTVFTEGTNRLGGGVDLDAFTAYFGDNSPVSSPGTDRIDER